LLTQPAYADADVDQRVFQQELIFGAAIAGVPAQEAVAVRGEVGRDVVLAEVDVIVRRNEGGFRPPAGRGGVNPLTGMATGLDARGGRRLESDE